MLDHPVIACACLALFVRVVLSVVLAAGQIAVQPDEYQYMGIAGYVAGGGNAADIQYGYGQQLFDATFTFMAPLVELFRVFGTHRIVGQLFGAIAGAAAAGMTVALGLRFLRRRYAVSAGILVALLPSQVFFSSLVLREGHIWLALVAVALGTALLSSDQWKTLAGGLLLAAAALVYLAFLRQQTLVAAAWALVLAAVVLPRRFWVPRVAACFALAVGVPAVAGLGPAGVSLVRQRAPTFAQTRALMAENARSSFYDAAPETQDTTPTAKPGTTPTAKPGTTPTAKPGTTPTAPPTVPNQPTRRPTSEEDSGGFGGLSHLPVGLLDVGLRPFPWQSGVGITFALARVENLAWYLLYALALVGLCVAIREPRARSALAFPSFFVAGILSANALTEGNVGTAFRHREQILWALALGASMGIQGVVARRTRRRLNSTC